MEQFVTELIKNPTLGFAGVVALVLLVWALRTHQGLEKRVDAALSKNEDIHKFYQAEIRALQNEFRGDIRGITERFSATQEQTARAVEALAGEVKEIKRYIWRDRGKE